MLQQYEGKRVRGPNGEMGVIQNGQLVVMPQTGTPSLRQVVAAPPKEPPPQRPIDAALDAQQLRNAQLEEESKKLAIERAKAGESDPKLTEGERKASAFLTRAIGSNVSYEKTGVGPRSLVGQSLADTFPNLLNQLPSGVGNSPERQVADSAQDEFIAASLRQDSGAAIPEEEMERQRRIYFPMPGDGPEAIEQKRQARLRAISGLVQSSGKSITPAQQEALQRLEADIAGALGGEPEGPTGRLTDEQAQAELKQRIARGDSPVATIKWLIDNNRAPDEETIAAIMANQGNRKPDVRPPNGGGLGRSLAVGVGDVVEGAGDILGIVGNPLNFGVNALFGTDLTTDLGQTFRDASGLPSPASDQERLASAINKGGVGALSLAGTARSAAGYAAPVIADGLRRFGAAPLIDTVAGAGGGGSSEGARQAGAGPFGQVAAGLLGGGASYATAASAGRRLLPAPPVENALLRAGQAENVDVNRAMAAPDLQNRVTGVEATMAGGPVVRREMGQIGSQIEAGVKRLGRGGEPLDESVAGQTVQSVAERSIKKSGQAARRQYDRAEKAAGDTKVAPAQSLGRVDEVLAKLKETPETNKAEIAFLESLGSDLANDLSVGALRRIRTSLRGRISKGELTFGEDEATVLSIMDAASDDIASGLAAAGKQGAARLFKRADEDYRERMQFIQGTIQKVIGKRNSNLSPERVFANLKAMATPKGDEAGLGRIIREADPDEQADIAATFAEALGKNNKGEFSTAFLVSQAEKLPKSAQVHVFGPRGAKSLENLVTLARDHSRVMGGLNHSRTGVANDWRSWMGNLIFGGGTGVGGTVLTGSGAQGAMMGVGAAVAGAAIKGARDVLSARALMSKEVGQWLADAPRTTSQRAIKRHVDRLSAIAVREPVIASELKEFQQTLLRAANENFAPSAVAEDSMRNEQQKR